MEAARRFSVCINTILFARRKIVKDVFDPPPPAGLEKEGTNPSCIAILHIVCVWYNQIMDTVGKPSLPSSAKLSS